MTGGKRTDLYLLSLGGLRLVKERKKKGRTDETKRMKWTHTTIKKHAHKPGKRGKGRGGGREARRIILCIFLCFPLEIISWAGHVFVTLPDFLDGAHVSLTIAWCSCSAPRKKLVQDFKFRNHARASLRRVLPHPSPAFLPYVLDSLRSKERLL